MSAHHSSNKTELFEMIYINALLCIRHNNVLLISLTYKGIPILKVQMLYTETASVV
jgi:hypothetical protein